MDCIEMEKLCTESACTQAGGDYSDGICMQGEGFQMPYYENATAECATMRQQCQQTDGLMLPPSNASCCGPVFVLLAALGFAAGSPRFK